MGLIKDFKEFAMKGNMVDLAVGVIIGAAFGKVINSLVSDVFMPPIGKLTGNAPFGELVVPLTTDTKVLTDVTTLTKAKAAGVATINYGAFIDTCINFAIVAFCVFMVVKLISKMKKAPPPADPTTKECPMCCSIIPIRAKKCPMCISEINA